MVRVSKHPDVRREEFLDATLELCTTIGWEGLSVDQITGKVGVAKGTFYYHFASRTDLLAAIARRYGDTLIASLDEVTPSLSGSAAERFVTLMGQATSWKIARLDDALAFIPLLYKRENAELRHHLFSVWFDQSRHLFRPLVELGHADGSFVVDDPEATTEITLSLWLDASVRMFDRAIEADSDDEFVDILVRGQRALGAAADRILGARPGTFVFSAPPDTLRALRAPFLAALGRSPQPEGSR